MKNSELFDEAVYLYNTKQYEDAVYLFEGLVDQKNTEALNYLGGCYLDGLGVIPDTRKAFEYLITAAVLGHKTAQFNLARFYEKRPKDVNSILSPLLANSAPYVSALDDLHEAPMYWYYQSANQGFGPALTRLGHYYAVAPYYRFDEAVNYYRLSAASGEVYGQYALGWCYEHGGMFNMLTNYEMAAKWYHKAAEQKHPQAMMDLSRFYANGIGVPVDGAQSVYWLNEAIANTNEKRPCKIYDMMEKNEIANLKNNKDTIIVYTCSCNPNIQCGLGIDDRIYIDEFGSKRCELRGNIECFNSNSNCKEIMDVRIEAELSPLREWEYM